MNKDRYDAGLDIVEGIGSGGIDRIEIAELELAYEDKLEGPKRKSVSDPNGVDCKACSRLLPKNEHSEHTSLSVKRKATVRMSTSICMYMPPTVEVKYGADYTDTEIGTGTMHWGCSISRYFSWKRFGYRMLYLNNLRRC